MKKTFYFIICLLFTSAISFGQDSIPYESKVTDLGEIQMEYMDFGGDGPVLIWVQDFHNYFEGPYKDPRYYPFFEELSTEYRVLAPLRCGYGKSTERKWGYDVATQSMDLLHFMDALKIDKAILYGRPPGNQDMTWIAEYYPERILGLIYSGNPILIAGCSKLEVIEFIENWVVYNPEFDKEKVKRIILSRAFWRPKFLDDHSEKIDIPTLRIINKELNKRNPNIDVFELGGIKGMSMEKMPGREEERLYLQELLQDSLRYDKLHKSLIECNPANKIELGMQRAFGKNLTTVFETDIDITKDGLAVYLEWEIEHLKTFKTIIKQ